MKVTGGSGGSGGGASSTIGEVVQITAPSVALDPATGFAGTMDNLTFSVPSRAKNAGTTPDWCTAIDGVTNRLQLAISTTYSITYDLGITIPGYTLTGEELLVSMSWQSSPFIAPSPSYIEAYGNDPESWQIHKFVSTPNSPTKAQIKLGFVIPAGLSGDYPEGSTASLTATVIKLS